MPKSVVVTEEAVSKLARDLQALDKEIAGKMEQRTALQNRFTAMRVLLTGNGGGPQGPTNSQIVFHNVANLPLTWNVRAAETVKMGDANTTTVSVPAAIRDVLAKSSSPMTPGEIRERLVGAGVPAEKFGATLSYLYTVLARLRAKKQIEKVRGGKYRLPQITTSAAKPGTEEREQTAVK